MKEEYKYMIGAKDPNGIIRAYALGDNKKATWKHCEKMLKAYLEGKKNIPINIADAAKSMGTGYKSIDMGLRISFPESGTPIKLDTDKGDSVDNVPLKAENFGKIFIEDEAPYRAIMITVEDGQLIRDPLN